MITFVIPLKSAQVANDWNQVSRLFERTLASVCNQTSPEFRAIVVCHERPQISFNHPQVTYLEADFPAPRNTQSYTRKDYGDRRLDHCRKRWTGIKQAISLGTSYVMTVDADDCISRRIAEFVLAHLEKNGWYLGSGYEYEEGNCWIFHRTQNFHQRCGTSHIVRQDLIVPQNLEFDDVTEYYLRHQTITSDLAERGFPLECLPFPGAVYAIGHQESTRRQKEILLPKHKLDGILSTVRNVMKSALSQPLTEAIRQEFGICDISPNTRKDYVKSVQAART